MEYPLGWYPAISTRVQHACVEIRRKTLLGRTDGLTWINAGDDGVNVSRIIAAVIGVGVLLFLVRVLARNKA
jgi:hypothetical protein